MKTGTGWGDAALSQGWPTTPRSWTGQEGILPEPPEGARPAQCLDFGCLASRAVREHPSVVLTHLVCGKLLQQPQDTNTPGLTEPPHLCAWPLHEHSLQLTRILGVSGPRLTSASMVLLSIVIGSTGYDQSLGVFFTF